MKVKKFILTLLLSMSGLSNNIYGESLFLVADNSNISYGVKNWLLLSYLVGLFLFWLFIYLKTPEFKFQKKQYIKSITNLSIRTICWLWFIGIAWIFKTIIFVSKSSTFLPDKTLIISILIYITIIVMSIIGIIHILKYFYNSTGIKEGINEIWGEVINGK